MFQFAIFVAFMIGWACGMRVAYGYLKETHPNDWGDMAPAILLWPISLVVMLIMGLANLCRFSSLDNIGERMAIWQRQRKVRQQETLIKMRVEVEQAEKRLREEAEAEVEACLKQDKFTC